MPKLSSAASQPAVVQPLVLRYTNKVALSATPVMSRMPRVELLVTDLDNTLYDWAGFFAKAFAAMVDVAVELLQVDREQLLDDLQAVHQRHHDSERAWSLAETEIAVARWPGCTLAERKVHLDAAFHAFNRVRKQHLKLYPGVWATLVRVTHWTSEDVERVERARHQFGEIVPDVPLEHFAELLKHFEFGPRRNLVKYA